MKIEASSKMIVILLKMSMINILAAQPKFDEELEELFEQHSLPGESLPEVAEKIMTGELEPMIAQVIRHTRSSSAFKNFDTPPCGGDEIEKMASFHDFMSKHSMKYRNIDGSSQVISFFISSHWNFIIKCLTEENNKLTTKLDEAKWKRLAGMAKKFWRITSTKSDVHFLNIASDIDKGRRKIRGARESPNDWAKLFRGLLVEKYKSDLQTSEENLAMAVKNALLEGIEENAFTKMKYPKAGYIDSLYDQLISESCKTFQVDEALIISLKKVLGLARATQWPEIEREDRRIFVPKFEETALEHLALGLVVCNHLEMDENFKKEAIESGVEIVQALDDRSPLETGMLDENELGRLLSAEHTNRVKYGAKKVVKYLLEPEDAYVIEYAQSSPIFRRLNPIRHCTNNEIEKAKNFHSFMLRHSARYRNIDGEDLRIIRLFVSGQWQFMNKCLTVENQKLNEESKDYDSLMRMAKKFLRITRKAGDIFFLDIASGLSAGRRRIRDAGESPSDWAEIFKEMLILKTFDTLFGEEDDGDKRPEEEFWGNVYDNFENGTELDRATGMRYPRKGYMKELYGLIMHHCQAFQEDRKLVESLNQAKKLAEITHWPKTFNIDRKMYQRFHDEPPLGVLALTSAVCDQLNSNYLEKVIDNGVAIVAKFTDMRQYESDQVDEEHLEDLLMSGRMRDDRLGFRAKRIVTAYLEPNLARIIEFVKLSPIFMESYKPLCNMEQIEEMKEFHNLMRQISEQYRYIDSKFLSVRRFIDGQWKYMLKCLGIEFGKLREKFLDGRWKSLAIFFIEFWNITSLPGDLYSLNIASDLLAGNREIRGADKSPRDWAKLIEGLLEKEILEALNSDEKSEGENIQELATLKVNNVLQKEIRFDAITGVKYPSSGLIGEFYDRLILKRCKGFLGNSEIAEFLDYVTNLGGITQWPKKGRINGRLLSGKFDDGLIGSLALGRVICHNLSEDTRKAVTNNEIAIFDALTDGILVDTPTSIVSMLNEDETINEICVSSLTLVDITHIANRNYRDRKPTSMLLEQMAQLESVASLAPDRFLCEAQEIEKINFVSKSVSRILSTAMGTMLNCFEHLKRIMLELKEHFVDKCLRDVVASINMLADVETKIHVLKMPRFELIIGQESKLSLKESLRYAGLLLSERKRILDPSKNGAKWKDMLKQAGQALFRGPDSDIPEGLKKYWNQAQRQSMYILKLDYQNDGKIFAWMSSVYRDLILRWCNIFRPESINRQPMFMRKVEQVVKIASFLLILEDGYENFSNLQIKSENKFLLKQSVLGYSVCNKLDPTFEFKYPSMVRGPIKHVSGK